MENIMNIIQNYGLGFASFIALFYFYNYVIKDMKETNEEVLKDMKETNEEVLKTLLSIQSTLSLMNDRINKLENKVKGD